MLSGQGSNELSDGRISMPGEATGAPAGSLPHRQDLFPAPEKSHQQGPDVPWVTGSPAKDLSCVL